MNEILLFVIAGLLIGAVVLLFVILRKVSQSEVSSIAPRLDAFEKAQERIERVVREEVAQNREELGKAAREQRQDMIDAFKSF